MNMHDLPATVPATPSKLITGSHGDHVTDTVVGLIEYCWASGLSARVAATRTRADFHFVQRIYVKCDQALVERTRLMKQELIHG